MRSLRNTLRLYSWWGGVIHQGYTMYPTWGNPPIWASPPTQNYSLTYSTHSSSSTPNIVSIIGRGPEGHGHPPYILLQNGLEVKCIRIWIAYWSNVCSGCVPESIYTVLIQASADLFQAFTMGLFRHILFICAMQYAYLRLFVRFFSYGMSYSNFLHVVWPYTDSNSILI